MSTSSVQLSPVKRVTNVGDMGPRTLLGICTSLKPAQGRRGRSAARSLLEYSLATVSNVYPEVYSLDLRDHAIPFFDGRMPDEYQNNGVSLVSGCVARAGALLISVPAYWCGVVGVFKNFVDILCGPAYDLEEGAGTVFTSKPVGLVIVGADEQSAAFGAEQAERIMKSTGAVLISPSVVVANPRSRPVDEASLSRDLVILGAELIRSARANNL